MELGKRLLAVILRKPPFLIALVAQIVVSVSLTPWKAATDLEFYRGAKLALVIGLIVHAILRLALPRLRRAAPLNIFEPDTKSFQDRSSNVFLCFVAAMAISLACGLAIKRGFVGELIGTALCVALQQLVFITAVFNVQQPMRGQDTPRRSSAKLIIISLLALYFSLDRKSVV